MTAIQRDYYKVLQVDPEASPGGHHRRLQDAGEALPPGDRSDWRA